MNISAVHPFYTDEQDHLLNATGLIWTSNATTKTLIGKVFAAPLKSTGAAQDFIYSPRFYLPWLTLRGQVFLWPCS